MNLDPPLFGGSSQVYNNKLYIFGGKFQTNSDPESTILEVDPALKTSKIVGQLPFSYSHGCVVNYQDDKIILMGGIQKGTIFDAWINEKPRDFYFPTGK